MCKHSSPVWPTGNEPDLYKTNGLRPSNWTIQNMVSEWNSIAGHVSKAVGLTKGASPSWIALSFAASLTPNSPVAQSLKFLAGW